MTNGDEKMKTKKQVISEYPEYKPLINAVINNIGIDSINDVNNHGINGGFSGFIYYTDTHKFAMKYRKTIIELLINDSKQFGEEIIEMVSHFGIFRNNPIDSEDKMELYKYIGMGKCEQSTITNLMAWYAAETVCRWFESN